MPKEQNLQLDINLSGKKLLSFYWIFSPLLLSLKLNFYFIFCLTLLPPPLFDILPEKIIANRLLSLLLFLFYEKFYFPIQTRSSPRLPQRNFLLSNERKKKDNRLSTFFCVQDTQKISCCWSFQLLMSKCSTFTSIGSNDANNGRRSEHALERDWELKTFLFTC